MSKALEAKSLKGNLAPKQWLHFVLKTKELMRLLLYWLLQFCLHCMINEKTRVTCRIWILGDEKNQYIKLEMLGVLYLPSGHVHTIIIACKNRYKLVA